MPQQSKGLSDEEIAKLEAADEIGGLSDDEVDSAEGLDPYYRAAEKGLRNAGEEIVGAVGRGAQFVDKYTGAPIRAAVGAAQEGKPAGKAFLNQYLDGAEPAPSGKQIMSRFGVSEEEFSTPLIKDPFTMERYKASPAGIAGGAVETVLDPTTFIPGGLVAKGLQRGTKLVDTLAPRAAGALGRFAEERAAKASTGESIRALKKMAKVKGQNASDATKTLANIRKVGREMLTPDPNFPNAKGQGTPAIGWLSNAQDIGETAIDRKRFYGNKIGEIGPIVDELNPEGIAPQALAEEVAAFSKEIPRAGKGRTVGNRVAEEAEVLRNYSPTNDQIGPARPLKFKEAQNLKGQYPFEPQSADILISDKDASNRINRIIGERMDRAAQVASANPAATPEQLAKLQGYDPAKQKYGMYKDVAEAGAEQGIRTLNRRMVSPSSNFLGATAGSAAAQVKDDLAKGGLWGAGVGLVNQQLLERGSALGARSADAISRKLMSAPATYKKWLPIMQSAAVGGNAAVLQAHHQLMNNDPEYRRLMLSGPTEEP